MSVMTKGEREDLQRLIRQREKVLKSAAKQRSTELLAEFENQLAAQYSFDQDSIWKEATRLARAEVAKANERIAAQCAKLGIPKDFAPGLHLGWHERGGNSTKQRRDELRKVAVSRIAAIEQAAVVKIELASVEAQSAIAASGLTSEAARSFLERLPSIEKGIVHILGISRVVIRIHGNHVPLAATEAVRLAFVDSFIYHIPDVDAVLIVIDQRIDVVL